MDDLIGPDHALYDVLRVPAQPRPLDCSTPAWLGPASIPDPELTDWAEAYHGPNHARLAAIKHHYDPERVFHFPQSL
jgi:hypothetical protein